MKVSDGDAEIEGVTDGSVELDGVNPELLARVVVVDEDDSIIFVTEDVITCVSNVISVVVDAADGIKFIEDTSLIEEAKVMLSFSQEHGEPSGEQQ